MHSQAFIEFRDSFVFAVPVDENDTKLGSTSESGNLIEAICSSLLCQLFFHQLKAYVPAAILAMYVIPNDSGPFFIFYIGIILSAEFLISTTPNTTLLSAGFVAYEQLLLAKHKREV